MFQDNVVPGSSRRNLNKKYPFLTPTCFLPFKEGPGCERLKLKFHM